MSADHDTVVYKMNPWARAGLWCLSGFLTIVFGSTLVMINQDGFQLGLSCFIAGLLILEVAFFSWMASYTRLELSAGGLRARWIGVTLQSAWTDIACARVDDTVKGFITSAPMRSDGATRAAASANVDVGLGSAGQALFGAAKDSLMQQRLLIPLDQFEWYLRHGDLAAVVDRFAPRLAMTQALAAADAAKRTSKQH